MHVDVGHVVLLGAVIENLREFMQTDWDRRRRHMANGVPPGYPEVRATWRGLYASLARLHSLFQVFTSAQMALEGRL